MLITEVIDAIETSVRQTYLSVPYDGQYVMSGKRALLMVSV